MSVGITPLQQRRGERLLLALVALAAATGVGLQLFLALTSELSTGVASTTIRLLSYFTIVSNVMVALAAGHAAIGGGSGFLGRPSVRAAIVVFIVVTGVVYAVLIAPHVHLEGAYVWSNALLHDVTPIAYPLAWTVYGAHGRLRWSDAARWLSVPAIYSAWTLGRGEVTGQYPYAFVDVPTLGWGTVIVNTAGLLAGFLILGLLVVAIDRGLGRVAARRA